MPDSSIRYCVVAAHYADGGEEFLAVEGKIVIFDTLALAQEVIPRFAGGRFQAWDVKKERIVFAPMVTKGFNQMSIWTNYDPYDVPSGFRSKGIYSEAKGLDWKNHIHYSNVIEALIAWADVNSAEVV